MEEQKSESGISIRTRILLPIVLVSCATTAVLGIFAQDVVHRNIINNSQRHAEATILQYKLLRAYYTEKVVKKIVKTGSLRVFSDHAGREDTVPLPATMIHDLSELLKTQNMGLTISLYSKFPFPNRAGRRLDAFALRAIEELNAEPGKVIVTEEKLDGVETVRVAIADQMQVQACVQCHNTLPDSPKKDWKLNDVRGVLEVRTNIENEMAENRVISLGIIGAGGGSVVLLLVFAFFIIGSVTRRIRTVRVSVAEVEKGDLTQKVRLGKNRDALGMLAQGINTLVSNTHSIVSKIKEYSGQVLVSSEQMEKASADMTVQAQGTGEKSMAISAAAEQMSTNLHEVSDAISRMSASIGDVNGKTAEAARITGEAAKLTESASGVIGELEKSTNVIANVIESVSDIAEQTNLLALNARIEAASAGAAGTRFAVVAAEIKNLAVETSDLSTQVKEKLQVVQDQSGKVSEFLHAVMRVVEKADLINASIAAEMRDQALSSQDIARNIEQLNSVAHEVARNISHVGDSMEENAVEARNSAALSVELRKLSQELARLVERFKL